MYCESRAWFPPYSCHCELYNRTGISIRVLKTRIKILRKNNQNMAQNQMQLTNMFFFNPTSRRDGTITQFIRIMFYLAFPLQSSQYFHWLLYWNFSEQLFWDKFGLKKNWQRSKLFSVSIRVKCIAIALLSITQNIDYFKIEWGLTEIKGLRTKETIFMIKENV